MRYFKIIINWLRAWIWHTNNFSFQFTNDIPEKVAQNKILIIGEPENYWLVILKCPCGCKNIIHLNLLKEARPCWTFLVNKKKISLKPSIWRKTGCKSHFFIKNGKVKWV